MKHLISALLFAGSVWISIPTLAGDDIPIFQTLPALDDLADVMGFPESVSSGENTRSLVLFDSQKQPATNDDRYRENQGKGFGLLVYFAFGESVVLKQSIPNLDLIAKMLKSKRGQGQSIIIEGHTDAVGTDRYNQALSEERSRAVRRYLVSVHGIESSRLHPVGRGETSLYNRDDPEAQTNRRVVFRKLERSTDANS